MAPPLIEVADI